MNEIDTYLSRVSPGENQTALENMRKLIREILPDSVECISYGMPAFRVDGKTVAGFAAFKNHLTFFPFSGTTLDDMEDDLKGLTYTKSGVHFTAQSPLKESLVEKIIRKRLSEIS